MNKTIKIILFATTLCLVQISYSQNFTNQILFKNIGREDGMPRAMVYTITQDSLGYIWYASVNGANRYDGENFKVYPVGFVAPTDNLLNDQKLYTDLKGRIWALVGGEPLQYLNRKLDSFVPINSIRSPKCILQDSNLDIYVGTTANGIYKIDHKTSDTLQLLEKEKFPVQVNRFTAYNDNVYAATWNNVLKIERDGKISEIPKPIGVDSLFNAITSSKEHGLWLGSMKKGLYHFDEQTQKFVKFEGFSNVSFPDDLYIVDLNFDAEQRLWVSVFSEGLYIIDYKRKSIQHIKKQKYNEHTILGDNTSMTYLDDKNVMWVATDKGLSLHDPHLFKFNRLTQAELPTDMEMSPVNEITKDNDGNLWFSTFGSGVFKLSDHLNKIHNYTTSNSPINSNKLISIQNVNNELWATDFKRDFQVLRESSNNDLASKETRKLNALFVNGLFKDSDGEIWIYLINKGLIKYNQERIATDSLVFNPGAENSLPSPKITDIKYGDNGSLWIGTQNGICNYNKRSKSLECLPIKTNKFCKIYQDGDFLWIWSIQHGLQKYNLITGELNAITKKKPTYTAKSLTSIEDWLWLSSSQGIIKINKKTGEEIQFKADESLQDIEFTSAVYHDTLNDILYYGGPKGINWFHPETVTLNPYPPETLIQTLFVNDEIIAEQSPNDFHHNQNTLSFTIASLHYSLPEKNRVKYRLLNYENSWVDNGTSKTIRYSNLPAGNYQFEATSSNYDGTWDATPVTYKFTILKPWYATNLVIALYILMLGFLSYYLILYLKGRWELKSQLINEQKEAERLKELDSIKNRLYTNISHEFRTPLTLITGPIERQLNRASIDEEQQKDLDIVRRSAQRLLNLVDQLLDLAKLETGNLKLSVSEIDINILVKQVVSSFKSLANEKNITLQTNIQNLGKGYLDPDVLEKIINNLLSNAIKYTKENGDISFSCTPNDGFLIMTVINNGVNLSSEQMSKLFERYYQTSKANTGAGIGLSLVKELCVISHGSVVANLLGSDEIQFNVSLPIKKEAYNISELSASPTQVEISQNNIPPSEMPLEVVDSENAKPLLLIVEDDKEISNFIKSIFKERYKVKTAFNGEEGLKKALKTIPDIIISDVMMPIMDGVELTDKLKNNEVTSHIPIILLTAKSGTHNEVTGLKSGADDYITKPFNLETLQLKVENLLQLRTNLRNKYAQGFKLKEMAYTNLDEQFLSRLQQVLNDCISNPDLTSEELAVKVGMSRSQLHRKLKALSGKSTTELIRNQRTKLAKDLLENSDDSISEIAYKVGFNSPSYFITSFRKDYNEAPSYYRDQQ